MITNHIEHCFIIFAYSDFLLMELPFSPLAWFSVMLAVFSYADLWKYFMYFGFKLLVSPFLTAECRIEGFSAVASLGSAGLERRREGRDEWHGKGQERQNASLSSLPRVRRPAPSQGLVPKSGKCVSRSTSAGEKREESYLPAVVSCWPQAHPTVLTHPPFWVAQTWCWVVSANAGEKLMVVGELKHRYEVSYPGVTGALFFENTRHPPQ